MKTMLFTLTALSSMFATAAMADQITDAQIQNLTNMAQIAYSNADVAEARGREVAAAQLRRQAQGFEMQADYLRQQEENAQQLIDAIQNAASRDQ